MQEMANLNEMPESDYDALRNLRQLQDQQFMSMNEEEFQMSERNIKEFNNDTSRFFQSRNHKQLSEVRLQQTK